MALLQSKPQLTFDTGFTLSGQREVQGIILAMQKYDPAVVWGSLIAELVSHKLWVGVVSLVTPLPDSLQSASWQQIFGEHELNKIASAVLTASGRHPKELLTVGNAKRITLQLQQAGIKTLVVDDVATAQEILNPYL